MKPLRILSRAFQPALPAALASLLTLAAVPAWAGTLKGTVRLPDNERSTRLYQGYWRLENGSVPVQTTGGAKMETAVVLEDVNGAHPPPARTVTVELGGLDAHPRMVITGPGSVVELKNTGKVRFDLSTPEMPAIMPLEQLPPGATRRVRFDKIGGFAIRDAQYPHILISVLIVDSPFFATIDEKGSFSIAGVPDGKLHLKVWTRGRWAGAQEVDDSKGSVNVKVTAPDENEQVKEKEPAE